MNQGPDPGHARQPDPEHPETAGGQVAQSEPGQLEPEHLEPEQIKPGQIEPGQIEPGQLEPGQLEPGWNEVRVGGHPCEVYLPPTVNGQGLVVLYLHGLDSNAVRGQDAFQSQFDRHGLPVIAPRTGQSWWVDRISPAFDPHRSGEQHVMDHVLPFIAGHWGERIGLLGTCMGGQGALRLAYRHPNRFPVVAALAPAIDFQLLHKEGDPVLQAMYADPEAARQDTATLHIHPLNWPRHQFFCCDPTDGRWYEGADRLRMKLWSLGVPHECDLETSAGGHGSLYYNQMAPRAIGFLVERLEQERRRLV